MNPYPLTDNGRKDAPCEDCGVCVPGWRDGQVPLCGLCRAPYRGKGLGAWIGWIVSAERGDGWTL